MTRLAALILPALVAAPAAAQSWQVDHDASSVGFETTVSGGAVSGEFADWTAGIVLDPTDPGAGSIEARVLTSSGTTGNGQMDSTMLSNSGLNPSEYEAATFMSDDIRATAEGYEAHGTLAMAGTERDIVLPFTLAIDGDRAVADSRYTLAREDYGVGASSWGSAAAEVTLVLHIEADAAE